eukprot:CAMPEP_0171465868 /NCGR_PEP_ID=MMETSP0945-20130129/8830_1 /TAXON_ID=109269 /ORGANISM="Vaucheria litorea, Strain CCMP2940" /LENGTH=167 /DNA_ID=CAMNT_0011993673 /DNA_START=207 /DNA_END=710 /DNA_ORIENTATION=+
MQHKNLYEKSETLEGHKIWGSIFEPNSGLNISSSQSSQPFNKTPFTSKEMIGCYKEYTQVDSPWLSLPKENSKNDQKMKQICFTLGICYDYHAKRFCENQANRLCGLDHIVTDDAHVIRLYEKNLLQEMSGFDPGFRQDSSSWDFNNWNNFSSSVLDGSQDDSYKYE